MDKITFYFFLTILIGIDIVLINYAVNYARYLYERKRSRFKKSLVIKSIGILLFWSVTFNFSYWHFAEFVDVICNGNVRTVKVERTQRTNKAYHAYTILNGKERNLTSISKEYKVGDSVEIIYKDYNSNIFDYNGMLGQIFIYISIMLGTAYGLIKRVMVMDREKYYN
ncbi:MAG: hypothetical protein MJZ23_08680 [Paludibacteraceae bacterium]|nr:hypothetical protein [Paludibacteraceae bacterium]